MDSDRITRPAVGAGETAGPSASLLMNNRTLDRPKALDGLRPSFSAHVSWREHGAPVECAVACTIHCSLNLPRADLLLGMTRRVWRFHEAMVSGIESAVDCKPN
jgi:hypothetical protein